MSDVVETPAAEPVADPAVVAEPGVVAADPEPAEPDVDAQAETAIENAVAIPTGEKLVPVGPLIATRTELKATRKRLKDAEAALSEVETLKQQLAQIQPMAQAFQALQAQPRQEPVPAQPQGRTPEQTAELEALARDFDFYQPDGALDLARAERTFGMIRKQAQAVAAESVAPLRQQSLQEQAVQNIARAKATVHPEYGTLADPAMIDGYVQQIQNHPDGLAILANPNAMMHIWAMAHGARSIPKPNGAAPARAATPAPIPIERAGGLGAQPISLSAAERRAAKAMGLSESEYLESAKKMPW